MSGKSNRCQTWYYIRSYKYILKIYKPVQRQRKFSHVFGHTSENSSKTTLPARKKAIFVMKLTGIYDIPIKYLRTVSY